ncbi:MAG: ATP-binding protein [Candidatus Brocadiia bacterium]
MAEKRPIAIAVVDDDPQDVAIIRQHLEAIPDWDLEFTSYTDPEEALAQLAAQPVDAVCVDYYMGKLTGIDLLEKLRAAEPFLPVVILTGMSDETLAVEAMKAGAADYLPKSLVSQSSLKRAIANGIEKAQLRQAVAEERRKLRRRNRDLLRRNEEIHRFYHTLSHELKTPLTSAREFVCILLDGIPGPLNPEQREYLDIVRQSCDQINVYIEDLLDLTRAETGKLTVNLRPCSLQALVQRVVASMSPVADERGVRLSHQVEPDLPQVTLDDARISEVLSNLLSNALKFTPREGRVVVRAGRDQDRPGYLVIGVEDTGAGISREQRDRIFDRLYQADRDGTTGQRGLGLGLSICKELVRLHGGEIWVESEPGQGSTFSFAIPIQGSREQLERSSPDEQDPGGRGRQEDRLGARCAP